MKDLVFIKSSKYGIEVYLDESVDFATLLIAVEAKFTQASKFFANTTLAASFHNRSLTREEEQSLIDTITRVAKINIICIVEKNAMKEQFYRSIVEQSMEDLEQNEGLFYKGTLKRRQVLESEKSVIILGNVEPGAKVISKGNIIVLGSLKGSAHAGCEGDKSAFIVANSMEPKILKIADFEAKKHKLQGKEQDTPLMAVVDGSHIYLDPIT